jgi:ATP-dependent DNA ligase
VEHVASGTDLFRVICEQEVEGIVAKQANARQTPNAKTWVKIKDRK